MHKFGDIVLVSALLDPQGGNPKDRPCVVVTNPATPLPENRQLVVAISTVLPDDYASHAVAQAVEIIAEFLCLFLELCGVGHGGGVWKADAGASSAESRASLPFAEKRRCASCGTWPSHVLNSV